MAIALLPLMDRETIASNLARYRKMMGLRSTINLRKSVFGYSCIPGTRFPSGISYLAQQTSEYWNLTGEEIINDHTGFRYATMMASKSVREYLFERMLGHPSSQSSRWKGMRSSYEHTTNLRYCSECIAESMSNREPLYWNIDHQLMGAYFCVKHSRILKSVGCDYIDRSDDYTAEELIGKADALILKGMSSSRMVVVENVAKRIVNKRLGVAICKPVEAYRELFREAGFFRTNFRLAREVLISTWLKFFGDEFCHVTGMTANKVELWIERLTESTSLSGIPSPFMFIAADCFLEQHISLPGSYAPGLRLNEVALSNGLQPITPTLEGIVCKGALHRDADRIQFAGSLKKSGGWRLVCTCGVSYRMLDSGSRDTEELAPFRYGSRYRMRFRRLIARGVGINRAARELHLSLGTVSRWKWLEQEANDKKLPQRKVDSLRTEWRLLVKGISSGSRITAATKSKPAVYRALLRNDRDWLLEFNRSHRSWRPQSSYPVSEPTTEEVREAWQKLMQVDPPVRVSRLAVLERIGFRGERDRSRPFAVLLAELAESRSAFRERVISWLATLASEQRLDTCDDAIRRIGLRLRAFTREQRSRIQEIDSRVVGYGE